MSRDEFDASIGQATAVSVISCALVSGAVFVASFLVGRIYVQPQVTHVMQVLSLGLLISPYSIVGLARLNVDLRFREMAWIKLASGFVRYALTIWLAALGFGAVSFAWPVVAITVLETVLYAALTRMTIHPREFRFGGVQRVFSQSKWSLFGSFAESIVRQCDYAVLGLLVPVEIVGVYYFAFQLAMQPVLLFSESLRKVVMPIFSQLSQDKKREDRSITYASLFIGIIAAPGLLLLSVTAEPLLTLLWGSKWTSAIQPLQILAMVMPLQLLSLFVETLLQSRGLFRYWTVTLLLRGIGLGLAAAMAAYGSSGSAGGLSVVIAAYLAMSAMIEVYFVMKRMGLSLQPLLHSLPLPVLCSTLTAGLFLVFFDGRTLQSPLDRFVFLGSLFSVTVFVVLWLCCRSSFHQVGQLLRRARTS